MTTHFITAEIEINEQQELIAKNIEREIAKYGEPLRWAITAVEDKVDHKVDRKVDGDISVTKSLLIEAVVTCR